MAAVRTPPSLDALIPSWGRHLRAANLGPRTIQSYGEAATSLRRFLVDRESPTGVATIGGEDVEASSKTSLHDGAPRLPPSATAVCSNSSAGLSMRASSP